MPERPDATARRVGVGVAASMTQTVTAPATAGSAIGQAAAARPALAWLITSYFQHIPNEDSPRRTADVDAVIDGHLRAGAQRAPGQAKIRVFNPTGQGDEWSETSTVIDIVNDDMPGLVDAVIGSLTEAGVVVHRVLHPILAVRREGDRLVEVIGGAPHDGAPSGVLRESWIHVLIDRLADATKAEELEEQLTCALDDVRAIVADAPALMLSLSAAARELL